MRRYIRDADGRFAENPFGKLTGEFNEAHKAALTKQLKRDRARARKDRATSPVPDATAPSFKAPKVEDLHRATAAGVEAKPDPAAAKRERARRRREAAKEATRADTAPTPATPSEAPQKAAQTDLERLEARARAEGKGTEPGDSPRAWALREQVKEKARARRAAAVEKVPGGILQPDANGRMTADWKATHDSGRSKIFGDKEAAKKWLANGAPQESAPKPSTPSRPLPQSRKLTTSEIDALPRTLSGIAYARASTEQARQRAMADPEIRASITAKADTLRKQAEAPIQIAISGDKLGDLIKAGRFKNAHERVSGIGKGVPGYMKARKGYEDQIMGVEGGTPTKDRPIYGYAGTKGNRARAESYGNFHAVLKEDVKDRATVTFGDSLNGAIPPIAHRDIKDADIDTLLDARNNGDFNWVGTDLENGYSVTQKSSLAPSDYTEIQVHGGVSASDISAFKVNRTALVERELFGAGPYTTDEHRAAFERDKIQKLIELDAQIELLRRAGFDVIVK